LADKVRIVASTLRSEVEQVASASRWIGVGRASTAEPSMGSHAFQSFVSTLGADHGTEVLVSAIVALSHGSGLIAVAEGVETPGQRRLLVELGCDRAQGYLLSRPIDAESIAKLLHGRVLVQNP
jgi:hypothetical protein